MHPGAHGTKCLQEPCNTRSTTTNPTTSASPATEHALQLTYTFDDRHWRVWGLEKQLSCERLKVNLLVSRRELVHIDTLDLYAARLRRAFLEEAAAELYVEEATLKQDLGHVLLDLELRQDALIRERVARQAEPEPVLTAAERIERWNCCKIRTSWTASWPTTRPAAWWAKRPTSWSAIWPACRGSCG